MPRYFTAILLFMGCLSLLGQNITIEPIKIKGEIKDEKQKPVSYAHILESTDYELYAAILTCYNEFCSAGLDVNPQGN